MMWPQTVGFWQFHALVCLAGSIAGLFGGRLSNTLEIFFAYAILPPPLLKSSCVVCSIGFCVSGVHILNINLLAY